MAFPSTTQDDLATAWTGVRGAASRIKSASAEMRSVSLAGNVDAARVVEYLTLLAGANDALSRYTAVPGLSAYAQAQVGGVIDIVAEYNTMLAQINATRNWVLANFPKDGSGYLLYQSFDGAGRIAQRQFDTASLAGFRTQLDALLATIA